MQDINDNGPLLSVTDRLTPHSKLVRFDNDRNSNLTFIATVNENEIGPLIFYDESVSSARRLANDNNKSGGEESTNNEDLKSQHFVIFDSDLGPNASFEVVVAPSMFHPGGDKIAQKHLKFNPNGFEGLGTGGSGGIGGLGDARIGLQQEQSASSSSSSSYSKINNNNPGYSFSSSSLLAFNHEPFDFDTLNVEPEIDPVTGVASKIIRFNVSLKKYVFCAK